MLKKLMTKVKVYTKGMVPVMTASIQQAASVIYMLSVSDAESDTHPCKTQSRAQCIERNVKAVSSYNESRVYKAMAAVLHNLNCMATPNLHTYMSGVAS